jgi:hypothetical protein
MSVIPAYSAVQTWVDSVYMLAYWHFKEDAMRGAYINPQPYYLHRGERLQRCLHVQTRAHRHPTDGVPSQAWSWR